MNPGQICMSTERIVVDRKVGDGFVKAGAEKTKDAQGRRPGEGGQRSGRSRNQRPVERVERTDRRALAKGAALVGGGEADGH